MYGEQLVETQGVSQFRRAVTSSLCWQLYAGGLKYSLWRLTKVQMDGVFWSICTKMCCDLNISEKFSIM